MLLLPVSPPSHQYGSLPADVKSGRVLGMLDSRIEKVHGEERIEMELRGGRYSAFVTQTELAEIEQLVDALERQRAAAGGAGA